MERITVLLEVLLLCGGNLARLRVIVYGKDHTILSIHNCISPEIFNL